MRKLLVIIGFVWAGLNSHAQQTIQPESVVKFSIGGIGWSTVEGTFNDFSGTVNLTEPIVGSSFNVCIQVSTVFTDNSERDEHLKNEDFFNLPKFPKICFKSTQVKKVNEKYVAVGDLTMVGVTKRVEIPFNISKKEGKTVLTGKFEVNRFDYSLAKESYSSTIMVDDVAEVEVICVVK